MFTNEYDVAVAIQRFDAAETTNRLAVARLVERLIEWTNSHSDGWAYWAKPGNAARAACGLIIGRTYAESDLLEQRDATDAVVRRALSPIKAFCTRSIAAGHMTVTERDYILGSLA